MKKARAGGAILPAIMFQFAVLVMGDTCCQFRAGLISRLGYAKVPVRPTLKKFQ